MSRMPSVQSRQPLTQRAGAAERLDHPVQPVAELGEPAGQFDAVAADVVQRQRGLEPVLRVVGQRHPGQDAVQAKPPGVVDEVDAVGLAVLLIESPAWMLASRTSR